MNPKDVKNNSEVLTKVAIPIEFPPPQKIKVEVSLDDATAKKLDKLIDVLVDIAGNTDSIAMAMPE